MQEFEPAEEEELYEHYRIVADPGQALLRIDKFLMDRIGNTSRTKIQEAAVNGNVLVNNQKIKSNYRVKPGDEISIVLPHPVREIELLPEQLPLDILFEDDHLIIVNKAAGMVVHPGYGNYTGTLVNGLLGHFSQLPLPKGVDAVRPGLVHRIDKNTTGVMVVAKTEQAHVNLAKQFFDRTIDRKYLAIAWGDLESHGTITGHLARSLKDRKVMDVFPDGLQGKHAITHYKVLERLGYITVVECKLETGRTHQIRVHFKYIGHPLFNDPEYGGNRMVKGTTFTKYRQFIDNCFELLPRQALHAKSLAFTHPATGKWQFFEAPLPEDMTTLLEKWRAYVSSPPAGRR